MGKDPEPTYALIDSRSVETAHAAQHKGFDGGKKVKGRKQHITTDTQGHLLYVKVRPANIHDTIAGGDVIKKTKSKYPTIKGVGGDAGFRGTFKTAAETIGLTVDIIQRIADVGWQVLPRRWCVERTFSWMGGSRRLSKDYEFLVSSAESMVKISHAHTLLRRV
ncbi:MAG: transposase [Defluviitaleaceae bacterium]|nr:transposase [Defluviitaleaceae bacterium]